MEDQSKDKPGILISPPLIYLGTFLFGYLIHLVFPTQFIPVLLRHSIGWPLMILSGVLALSGLWTLKRAGTHVLPHKPATVLVLNGPYRFTRNPLYLSLTLLYSGAAVLLNILWVFLLLPLALLILYFAVILREERYLERKFGEAYLRYKTNVRRWI